MDNIITFKLETNCRSLSKIIWSTINFYNWRVFFHKQPNEIKTKKHNFNSPLINMAHAKQKKKQTATKKQKTNKKTAIVWGNFKLFYCCNFMQKFWNLSCFHFTRNLKNSRLKKLIFGPIFSLSLSTLIFYNTWKF